MRTAASTLERRLPARLAVIWIQLRARIVPAIATALRVNAAVHRAAWWIVAIAVVLAYLCVAAWMDSAQLRAGAVRSAAVAADLRAQNTELEAKLAERAAMGTTPLLYLIEAESIDQAMEKLQRAAMLISKQHFHLQEKNK